MEKNMGLSDMVWTTVPISTLYTGLYDGPHATPKPSIEGPIFLGIPNMREDGGLDLSDIRHIAEEDYPTWTRRVVPQEGDIVFSYEATLHRYAIIPQGFRGCLGRRMALVRPKRSKVNTRYLYYYFFTQRWRETVGRYLLIGSTVDRIPLTDFPKFEVTVPPLPTQRRIAAVLSAYDALIENNARRMAILEDMARNLYREWFVKFRFPEHEDTAFVEKKGRDVPEGWEYRPFGELLAYHIGGGWARIKRQKILLPEHTSFAAQIYLQLEPHRLILALYATTKTPISVHGDWKLAILSSRFQVGARASPLVVRY